MNEKEAREIVELHKHLDEAINDPRLHSSMEQAIHSYLTAKGYLAGLEAERERVKPLVEAIRFQEGHSPGCDDAMSRGCPCTCFYSALKRALAAYTQPEGKEKL